MISRVRSPRHVACGRCAGPLVLAMLGIVSCSRGGLDREALQDPTTCQGCHPEQFREWASSMHAYASDDPIFVAMNRRGQRETGGALGTLCVGCHAPSAVAAGLTTDGLDLALQPRALRGVGCIACHQITAVNALHNGSLTWADDAVMRGGIASPVDTPAHGSERSALVDASELRSSDACGACHDVVLPNRLAVERTYAEWSESVFARPGSGLSCAACHMFVRQGQAAVDGPQRTLHDHSLPGVDLALTPWPGIEEQRAGIQRDLAAPLLSKLCVQPTGGGVEAVVTLDNVQVGHAFPSGVTHARRVWVELVAETDGTPTWSVGQFEPGAVIHRGDDPDVWILGSTFRDADGRETNFAWDTAAIESELLTPTVTTVPTEPGYYHSRTRRWSIPGVPQTVRVAVHIQPVGLDVVDELIASGDLLPAVRDAFPTFTVSGASQVWHATAGYGCVP